ncbi:hypothetical protein F2P56_006272 [Juglans regia]|uniref:Uncharacterized protein LOC108990614 n=2 Tax=Juglans regia TaxID=51240 RepID=A0A2I4EL80_JUGRE|nr:uncharacterized protein LOC108990614 [Juglans regia]KAF5474368.1 hypothetical protein F2P56_006272 [Juglans regia]
MAGWRFRELLKKYGKVALGVHFSVSAASITRLYVAIKNNVDVESLLEKLYMGGVGSSNKDHAPPEASSSSDGFVVENERPTSESQSMVVMEKKKRNRVADLTALTSGALALAIHYNKALFPIRVPITCFQSRVKSAHIRLVCS